MYALKSLARRGTALGMAAAVLAAATLPAAPAFADALNPLTDRSLTLSSSAPGWVDKDGSGNTTYAPPNSGANGKQTGNTFSFKVSTNSTGTGTNEPVRAMTFQYCTTPAGNCKAPGNNGYTGAAGDPGTEATNNSSTTIAAKTSNLDVVTSAPSQIPQASLGSYVNTTSGLVTAIPDRSATGTNFVVMYKNGASWVSSDGWTMTATNNESGDEEDHTATGANNEIRLVRTDDEDAGQGFLAGQEVKVIFFATDTNYITNPGEGAFFVRINTFKDQDNLTAENVIDGGVTVANVMNLSIQIQTKVLETMDFSVGTVDPDTLSQEQLNVARAANPASPLENQKHGICDPIMGGMTKTEPQNTLLLGDPEAEYSLSTAHTYSTHSYFRLSSNASAGATVYYSGVTLSNTVGDKIAPVGTTATAPIEGTEQFGIALANGTGAEHFVDYATERQGENLFESGADDAAAGLVALNKASGSTGNGIHSTTVTDNATSAWKRPQLRVNADGTALAPMAAYANGAGYINSEYAGNAVVPNVQAQFAYDETSNTIPVPLATEDQRVVDCATGKVRYMANIAATTPAGIYTTSINYIAAPQY